MKRLLILLALILILVACGGNESPDPDANNGATSGEAPSTPNSDDENVSQQTTGSDDPIIIKFAVQDWILGEFDPLVEAFEEENDDIEIRLVSVEEILDIDPSNWEWPDDANVKIASNADVFSSQYLYSGPDQPSVGLDLTPLIDGATGFNRDDFTEGAIPEFDGEIMYIPTSTSYNVFFYNKEAFDNAGIDYPEVGWTWEDFRQIAQQLTIRDGDEVTQWGFVNSWIDSSTFVLSQIKELPTFEENGESYLDFEDGEFVSAIRFYTDMFLVDQSMPWFDTYRPYDPESEDADDEYYYPAQYQTIEDGKAAMWIDSVPSYEWRSYEMDIGVAPIPTGDGPYYSSSYSEGYGISKGTASAQAAFKWIDFLSRQGQVGYGAGYSVPARVSVAEATGFWDNLNEDLRESVKYVADNAYQNRKIGDIYGFISLQEAIVAIIADEVSIDDALKDATEAAKTEADEILALLNSDDDEAVEIVVAADPEETVNEDAVSIRFLSDWNSIDNHRELANQFSAENPDIIIDIRNPTFGEGANTLSDIVSGSDCFEWRASGLSAEDVQVLLPLEPFIEADGTFSAENYYPFTINSLRYNGQLMGIPASANPIFMIYNKEIFDAAGVDYPTLDWDLNDFLEIAQAVSSGEGDGRIYGFMDTNYSFVQVAPYQFDIEWIDDSEEVPTVDLGQWAQALQFYSNLSSLYDVQPPTDSEFGSQAFGSLYQDFIELAGQGRVAMWPAFGEDKFLLDQIGNPEIGFAPMPKGLQGQPVSAADSVSAYLIHTDTEHRRECWEWISYLSQSSNVDSGLPARIDIAESAEFSAQIGPEQAALYLSIAEASQEIEARDLKLDIFGISVLWIYQAQSKISAGTPVDQALEEAQETFNSFRDCVAERDGLYDFDIQETCAREADEAFSSFFGP